MLYFAFKALSSLMLIHCPGNVLYFGLKIWPKMVPLLRKMIEQTLREMGKSPKFSICRELGPFVTKLINKICQFWANFLQILNQLVSQGFIHYKYYENTNFGPFT